MGRSPGFEEITMHVVKQVRAAGVAKRVDTNEPLPIWAQRGIQCMADGLRRRGMNLEDVAAAVAKSERHARRILYPRGWAENRPPVVSIPRLEQRVRPAGQRRRGATKPFRDQRGPVDRASHMLWSEMWSDS